MVSFRRRRATARRRPCPLTTSQPWRLQGCWTRGRTRVPVTTSLVPRPSRCRRSLPLSARLWAGRSRTSTSIGTHGCSRQWHRVCRPTTPACWHHCSMGSAEVVVPVRTEQSRTFSVGPPSRSRSSRTVRGPFAILLGCLTAGERVRAGGPASRAAARLPQGQHRVPVDACVSTVKSLAAAVPLVPCPAATCTGVGRSLVAFSGRRTRGVPRGEIAASSRASGGDSAVQRPNWFSRSQRHQLESGIEK